MKRIIRNIKAYCLKYRRSLRLNRWPTGNPEQLKRDALKDKLKDIW